MLPLFKQITNAYYSCFRMKRLLFPFYCLCFMGYLTFAQRQQLGQISTPQGKLLVWLYPETPMHRASFKELAKSGYWNTATFNRVVPNFVVQGGCPDTPEGFTDSTLLLKPEFMPSLSHNYGTFAAGRDNNPAMNSARCQFYIVVNKNGLPRLNHLYTVYGKVIKGMEVLEKIILLPRNKQDEPLEPVPLKVSMVKIPKRKLLKLAPELLYYF
jgi:peptidyl-prolyl cis-trans isomerase B (cyclophilin B)